MKINRRHFLQTTLFSALAIHLSAADAQRKLRVGIIGHTGRGDYGHGLHTMWIKVPEVEIVGIADPDPKGLAGAQQKLGGIHGYADYRQMLAELRPDIVAIATRHIDQHLEMAMAALHAGARGIYMEKPFCRTPAEADQIVTACAKAGAKLALAHRNRYHPVLARVKELIEAGEIGRLLELRGRGKEDQRGGALDLWVLGSHVLNLAHYFGGNPLSCSAVMLQEAKPVTREHVRDGPEGVGPIAGNQLHARFDMENGVPFYFDSIQGAGNPAANFGLQLIGSKGMIDLRVDVEPLAHLVPGSPFLPTKEPRPWTPISSAGPGVPEPIAGLGVQVSTHFLAAQDLISAIRDDRPALCSAEHGAMTVEMISAVFESHRLNGERVLLPLKSRANPLTRL